MEGVAMDDDGAVDAVQLQFTEAKRPDPLLALYGSGKDTWADEHADELVARLRRDWN